MSKKYIADNIEVSTGLTLGGNNVLTTASGYATELYVNNAISGLINSAPATLDTLNELAAALDDDPNFATTVANSIGLKWTQDNDKISNWNTAYGWGNHAGLYLPISGKAADSNLLDGLDSDYFDHRRYTDSSNYIGGYYVSGGTEKPNNSVFGAGKFKVAMLSGGNLGFGGSWNDVMWISTYSGGDVKSSHALVFDKYSSNVWVSDQNFDSASWGTGYLLITSANIGSQSVNYATTAGNADTLDGSHASAFALASHTHSYVSEGGTSFSGEYPVVVRVGANNFYSDANIRFQGSDSKLTVDGSVHSPIFYDTNNTGYYIDPASKSNFSQIAIQGTSYYFDRNTSYFRWQSPSGYIDIGSGNTTWAHFYTDRPGFYFGPSNVAFDGNIFGYGGNETASFATYYDSNNTAYFLNPDTTGVSLKIKGGIVTDAPSGSILLEHQVAEANAWIFKENAANWGLYWFNAGANSGQGMGSYTTVGAELFGMNNASTGFNPPETWAGIDTDARAAWMLSNYSGYFWSQGTQYSETDMRAPLFYDANNTGYYVDPASTSVFSYIQGNTKFMNYGNGYKSYNLYGMVGDYDQNSTSEKIIWTIGDSWNSIGNMYGLGYTYGAGYDHHLSIKNNGTIYHRIGFAGNAYFTGEVIASTSHKSPIFYDSNNTGYYLDPHATSNLNTVQVNTIRNDGSVSSDDSFGIYWTNTADTSYAIYRESGGWSSPYPDLRIAFHTGIKLGANAGYNGIRFYTDSDMATQVMSVNNGGDGYGAGHVYVNNIMHAGGSHRAPIFYDGDNTNYYLNPASGTSLYIDGGVSQNNLVGRPYAVWGSTGTTGAVVIKFPGGTGNYGMIHAVIDIYEYSGDFGCTVIVSGHNWNGQWYNYGAQLIGKTNKLVRLGFKDGKYCIVIGNGSSSWSYGQVVLRKIQNGAYYQNVMNVSEGYTIGIESDSYSWITGDLRQLNITGNIISSVDMRAPIFYDNDNTGYYVNPAGNSYLNVVGAANRFYVGYDSGVAGSMSCSDWFRSSGSTGWYNASYAGGIYMVDSTWVRVYNSKAFYVANQIAATGDVTAYYSDERLKDKKGNIENPIEKVQSLNAFYYTNNELAKENGYTDEKLQVGLSAQEVQAVMPEIVSLAPFDMEADEFEEGKVYSKSGENYLTVNYAKLVPLLIEAIKEQQNQIEELKALVNGLTK